VKKLLKLTPMSLASKGETTEKVSLEAVRIVRSVDIDLPGSRHTFAIAALALHQAVSGVSGCRPG
jgi:hypothetical protein